MKSLKITALVLFTVVVNLAWAQKAAKAPEEIATEKRSNLPTNLV